MQDQLDFWFNDSPGLREWNKQNRIFAEKVLDANYGPRKPLITIISNINELPEIDFDIVLSISITNVDTGTETFEKDEINVIPRNPKFGDTWVIKTKRQLSGYEYVYVDMQQL